MAPPPTTPPPGLSPVPAPAHPAPSRGARRPLRWWLAWILAPLVMTLVGAHAALDAWSRRTVQIAPRHRAEALCFALSQPPPFAPPMEIQTSVAFVRGRFNASTPASLAIRQRMNFTEDMVTREWSRHVGDYDVTLLWLYLRDDARSATAHHWLVAAWMEGDDLAVCNFRFAGAARALSPAQLTWGSRLLERILRPEYFRANRLPAVLLKATGGPTMPGFGPTHTP